MPKKLKQDLGNITIDGVEYTLISTDTNEMGIIREKSIIVEYLVRDVENGRICRDVIMQRTTGQWNRKQESMLILSILMGRPIGEILITGERVYGQTYAKNSIIDGLQRTTAICRFVNNEYALDKSIEPLKCRFKSSNDEIIVKSIDIAGKKFNELPEALQSVILEYNIKMYSYSGFTDAEMDDIVFCVNNGTTFKPCQKIRTILGTTMMKKIQPICDSTFWEKTTGCKEKNDTILGCIVRSLMLVTGYEFKNLGTAEMTAFSEYFSENGTTAQVQYISDLYDQLDEITDNFSEEDYVFLDACNIPHLISSLDQYNGTDNPANDEYFAFLNEFIHSDEKHIYDSYCVANGGGGKYSEVNVMDRQSFIDNALMDYISDDKDEINDITIEVNEDDEGGKESLEHRNAVEDSGSCGEDKERISTNQSENDPKNPLPKVS